MPQFYYIPTFPKAGERVTFYPPIAAVPEVTSYLWNFGDGTLGTGYIVTHTYQEPGNYLVTLSLPDGSTEVLPITVVPAMVIVINFNYIL